MRSSVAVAVAGTALAMLGAAAASSAAGWSTPQTISRSHDDPTQLAVAYTAAGRAVASWRWIGAAVNGSAAHWSMAARPVAGGRFAPERELPDATIDGPHAYGSDRVLVATRSDRADRRTGAPVATTLAVRFGDLRGRFGAAHVIQRSAMPIGEVRLAVNRRGAAVVVWTTYRDELRGALYASLRPRGGAFGRPLRLADSFPLGRISAAIGSAGDVLVAWRHHGVRTRFKGRSDRAFRPVDLVRSEPAASASLFTAVTTSGSARVGWFAQSVASGGTIGIPTIQLARRPGTARRFERALLIARGRAAGGRQLGTDVSFAIGPRGRTGVAWACYESGQGSDNGFVVVRVALVDASEAVTVRELARSPAREPGQKVTLTFADDGEAAVAWTTGSPWPPFERQVYVARRPAHGAWTTPEPVAVSATELAASYVPRGGPLTLLFNSWPAGSRRNRIQVVTRTAA